MAKKSRQRAFLDTALEFLEIGLRPIPIKPDTKSSLIRWKEHQERCPTEEEVGRWGRQWPNANIAIVTGSGSGVDCLDIDKAPPGWPPNGCELPAGCVVQTPRGGSHYWFKHVEGARSSAGAIASGVDVRADGGYALIPPSVVDGKFYSYVQGSLADALEEEAPDWLVKVLRRAPEPSGQLAAERKIPEGRRNIALTSLAGSMRHRGAEKEAVLAALKSHNLAKCNPPLPEIEVEQIVNSVVRYEPKSDLENLTDVGNALRLVRRHGDDLRYCHLWKLWLVWDGKRWSRDETGEVVRRAKDTIRLTYAEASDFEDSETRKKLAGHAIRSESERRIKAMLSLAESELPITPGQLDQDPWLLNVENGTIDLKTGMLHPHNREELITKIAPVAYDPDVACPTWWEFLDCVMDHSDNLTGFLQRAVGYALTGDVSEQALFFLYGIGANGKSTFLSTVLEMLGDYGKQAAPELLSLKRSGHPTDVADIAGARLVASLEVDEGTRMAEALVKQMTGGDRMKARFMRQDFFEFRQTAKIFLAANHKPQIRGTDLAIWRRIRLIPFNVVIPEPKQDKKLPDRLRKEFPGILAWAVRGCQKWRNEGLSVPQEVSAATADYKDEMDVLKTFIEDCCVIDSSARARAKDLYKAYKDWCDKNGERHISQRVFGTRLGERGLERRRGAQGVHMWIGIGLVTEVTEDTPISI